MPGNIPELPNGWEMIEYGEKEPAGRVMICEYGSAWRDTNAVEGREHIVDDRYRVARRIKPVNTEW